MRWRCLTRKNLSYNITNQIRWVISGQEVLAPRVEIDMPALTRYDNGTITFRFSAVNGGDTQSGNLKNIKGHTT
jgi:hypothetical protein